MPPTEVAASQSDGGNSLFEGPSSQVHQVDYSSQPLRCPSARASHPTGEGSGWCGQPLHVLDKRQDDMKLVPVANSLCDLTSCFISQSLIPLLGMLEEDLCGILVIRNKCHEKKGLSGVPDKP